ncbi:hypothetical protein F4804DRAFT_263076 [Jackrogersella minutella]|nr:hypothetical protein F4804DRAFT_263076 [Jackrogersella minutella]
MAPHLESFKNIFNRGMPSRHNSRSQETTDDNKSPQQLNQEQASATTSLSEGPTQSKQPSEVSLYMPPKMNSNQNPSFSQSSKSQAKLGHKLGNPNLSGFPGPSSLLFPTKAPGGKSSQGIKPTGNNFINHQSDEDQSVGSKSNPIDLTGNPHYYHPYNPFGTSIYPGSSQGPGTSANHAPNPTPMYSPFHPNNYQLLLGPSYPITQSMHNTHHVGLPWENAGHLPDSVAPPTVPDFSSSSNGWGPSLMMGWGDIVPSYKKHIQPQGQKDDQGFFDKTLGDPLDWGGMSDDLIENLSPPTEEGQKPEADKVLVDVDSPADSGESSGDQEQLAEDTAVVEATLRELEPLQEFVRKCLERTCPKCTKKKSMDSKDVVKMTAAWAKPGGKILLGATCPNVFCTVSICLGCGKAISSSAMNGSRLTFDVSGTKFAVQWCCDHGRLAAIWALACGWDAPSWKYRAVSRVVHKVRERKCAAASYAQPMMSPHAHAHAHSHANVPANANARGVGYGGGRLEYFVFPHLPHYINPRPAPNPVPKKAIDTQAHLFHATYFRLLAILLPSCERKSALDTSPPEFLSHMLSRSPLIEQAATMLSNDSIDEISRQYQIYDGMLNLFDALASHPATAQLVYGDRSLYHTKGGSLLEVSIGPVTNNSKVVVKDTSKSLLALLEKLASQSHIILRHARGNQNEFHSTEGLELIKLSKRLSHLFTQHTTNKQSVQTEMDTSEDKPVASFSEWHRENCVKDMDDDKLLQHFVYAQEATRATNGVPARGRMKRLITEISTLKASLPEGIFIYHGSSRLDIMKVLIIGPKNTPYEHGIFEFDLMCRLDYPNSPPVMKFRTTNGGRIRFNPNLYEDGKICLSLLGTWAGEPWRANQSTILQVLVSIQSMILCEQPWYNEPGREENENKAQSARYNNEIRTSTVMHAILPWVKPDAPLFWQETAQKYLRANAKDVLNSVKQAASKSRKGGLINASMLMEAALNSHGYMY